MTHYILDENKNVVKTDLLTWAKMFESTDRAVKKETINGLDVSTVFLGTEMGFSDEGKPIVFETMIFGYGDDEYQERCSTWNEALIMHDKAVEAAKLYKDTKQ